MKSPNKRSFYFSAVSFFLSSAAIWFMPLASFEAEGLGALSYILAAVFWIFFALGFIFLRTVSNQRKKDKSYRNKSGIAFLRFFSNKPALIFDALLIAGVITLSLTFIIRNLPGPLMLGGTFATVFSLEMHGLFNGRNYEWIVDKER